MLQLDVVINSNTPESWTEQQCSMLLERAIVDRVPENPDFYQMFPSSEVTWNIIAPHIRPSYSFGEMKSGIVQTHLLGAARGKLSPAYGVAE
jgi:hypothetical protein